MWFFHGSGGSAEGAVTNVETVRIINALAAAGFGFIATESSDRTARQWSPQPADPTRNEDLLHLRAVEAHLVDADRLDANTPQFGLGHSNGGGFVSFAGALHGYGAIVVSGATGFDQVFDDDAFTAPVLLLHSENDSIVSAQESADSLTRLVERGVFALRVVFRVVPLTALRLQRIPALDEDDAARVVAALDDAGELDEDGFLIRSLSAGQLGAILPADLVVHVGDINDQLKAVRADHQLTSDARAQVVSFFEAQLPPSAMGFAGMTIGVGPTNEDEVDAVAADSEGNVTISGRFRTSLTIAGETAVGVGGDDIFVARLNRAGELQWLQVFGSTGTDNIFDAVADDNGDVILAGMFSGTVDFGGHVLTAVGGGDTVVMKMSPSGEVLWARQGSGAAVTTRAADDSANEVTVDSEGNILMLVGSGSAYSYDGSAAIEHTGSQDAIVLKLDPDGALLWARGLSGALNNRAKALGVDGLDNVYFGGDTAGSAVLVELIDGVGSRQIPGSAPIVSNGGADAFVVRFTPDGDLVWARSWGGVGDDIAKGLVGDSTGHVYAVGSFEGTVVDDGGTFVSAGETDLLLRRFAPDGTHVWTQHAAGTGADVGAEVEIDAADGLLFAGGIDSETTFSSSFGAVTLQPLGVQRGYAARYAPDGSLSWMLPATASASTNAQELQLGGTTLYVDIVTRSVGNAFGAFAADAVEGKDFGLLRIELPQMHGEDR